MSKFKRLSGVIIVSLLAMGCGKFQSSTFSAGLDSFSQNICKDEKRQKSVYGIDDRKDWFEIGNKSLLDLAKSTVAIMNSSALSQEGDNYRVVGSTLQTAENICPTEKFSQQLSTAFCSGFLVARDLVVTAGHCIVDEADCKKAKFVFDFSMTSATQSEHVISSNNVYSCSSLVAREQNSNADFAIIRLDRVINDRTPFNVRRSGQIEVGSQTLLIGHPSGLPSKVALGGRVKSVSSLIYAEVDAFAGNSGSAVINPLTRKVEGILVEGAPDYEIKNGCKVVAKCDSNCEGEGIQPVEKLLPYIPDVNYVSSDPSVKDEPICSIN